MINKNLKRQSNMYLNNKDHSPLLINWADIVINFGSSIAIEGLIQNKPIIHLPYLHTNRTIFDESELVYNANNIEELINFLNQSKKLIPKNYKKESFDKFMNKEIYCSNKSLNILEKYYEKLK